MERREFTKLGGQTFSEISIPTVIQPSGRTELRKNEPSLDEYVIKTTPGEKETGPLGV